VALLGVLWLVSCGNGDHAPETTSTDTTGPSYDTTEITVAATMTMPDTVFDTLETSPAITTAENTLDTEADTTVPPVVEPETTAVPETEPVTEEPEDPFAGNGPYVIDGHTYYIDVRRYLPYICPTGAEEYLVVANRKHPLGENYIPTDLVTMNTNEEKEMRAYASYALDAMVAEMKYLGVYDTFPQSPYRSYALQYKLYHRYLGEERALHPDYTEEQIIALVDSYSARPGTSDHQTGLAVDFYPISEKFEKRKAYTYLLENAHKFGFILRFPEGKTDITGYMFESWHWRFVGREAATYIHEHGITLEEYLGITG
jgi:LAS superfamily LD-carboxypeptidase LdcB